MTFLVSSHIMKLTIAESFLVLIHHPEKARYIVDGNVRNAGLIGSIFLDLSLDENIITEDGYLIVKSFQTKLPGLYKKILDKMSNSPRKRKPKVWISRFSQRSNKPRRELLDSLEKKGIVDIEHKVFLVFPYIRSRLLKQDLRNQMISDLRDIIFKNKEIDPHSASLLGLIQACKMHKVVCNDKAELKQSRLKIKEIIESDLITQGVSTVIQEMQAAMMAAIIASTAATTAASAASH